MIGVSRFNTEQFNQEKTLVVTPLATMTLTGNAPAFWFSGITLSLPVASMTTTAVVLAALFDISLTVPTATMAIMQRGVDTVEILAHYIQRAQYITESASFNAIYLIGRDTDGNFIFGSGIDETEANLIGERLNINLAFTIKTNASDVATAVFEKVRLLENKGVIKVLPNCGVELWDTVHITDALAGQDTDYRISGWDFTFDRSTASYLHTLRLTSI